MNWEYKWAFSLEKSDTIDLGTDGYEGMYMKVWTDIDSITFPYVNFPEEQKLYIPILNTKRTILYRLRFNPQNAKFSDEYINSNNGKISFAIPEVYELANIILYLSSCSDSTGNHPATEYSYKVQEYFKPFRNHKVIQVLSKDCGNNNYWDTYYGFRENSICFQFVDNDLQYNSYYSHVYYDNIELSGGKFRNLLYLVQDFVNISQFRKFYNENVTYYNTLINRQKQVLPIHRMWTWLEEEFEDEMDHYSIVFSPLIGGSHSTQKFFKGSYKNPEFKECVMFINSYESHDLKNEYSETVKQGLFSGIVFTEIDHNYVNPLSNKYYQSIGKLIKNKDFWASKKAQSTYSIEYSIFNEYMTHSLFCLYMKELYPKEIADIVIENRIKLMNRRGFDKFNQFNERLIHLCNFRTKKINDLYPAIFIEMESIK